MKLKDDHLVVLRRLHEHAGPLAASEVDGRRLRPLKAAHLVSVRQGMVRLTTAGARLLTESANVATGGTAAAPDRLSEAQAEVLWRLRRQREPVAADHLDGRILRALRARACVTERDGWVEITEHGISVADRLARRDKTPRRGSAGTARAQAIYRAVEDLERVLPVGSEVAVGSILAAADDVVQGFRALARDMERRDAQPRKRRSS